MNNTDQLTFTRFIAAILIVVYHFGTHLFLFNVPWVEPFFHHSNLGVSYFFLLSGFVMVIAYGRRVKKLDTKQYLQNRAARILPLYYLAISLMLLYYLIRIVLLKMAADYTPTLTDVVLNILLVQTWFPGKATTVNTAAWSLSVEAFFYVFFPYLLNRVYPKLSPRQIVWLAVAVFIISQLLFHYLLFTYPPLGGYFFYNPLLHLNEFVTGNAVGFLFLQRKKTENKRAVYFAMLFFALSVAGVFITLKNVSYHGWYLHCVFCASRLLLGY